MAPPGSEPFLRRAGVIARTLLIAHAIGSFQSLARAQDEVPQPESLARIAEEALIASDAIHISKHFADQVLVSFSGETASMVSAGQAHYLLESYLKTRKVLSVEMSRPLLDEPAFARGSLVLNSRGTRSTAQIFLSFRRMGEKWVVAQFTIR